MQRISAQGTGTSTDTGTSTAGSPSPARCPRPAVRPPAARRQRWVPGAGRWVLGAGSWVLGAGCGAEVPRRGCSMAEVPAAPHRTTGSTLLHPLSALLGIPLDQINFVACQLFALLAAFWFRIYLGPSHASSAVRHAFATLFGIYFAVFCFGWYSIHLFVLVMMNYGIMNTASIPNIHRYSFVVAMGYLTLCHISRIYIFHYGILTTDFSGPLMIITQKITTLACQLHDGIGRQAEELTAEQNRLAVKTRPSLLEYLSYLLNFMSIIAGPCSNYKDYIAFIEGRHVHMKLLEVNWKQKGYDRLPDPSPTGAVMYKLCITLVSLVLFLTLTKNFPMAYIIDNEFLDKTPFLSRLGYLYVVTQAAKPKYYFAWTLAPCGMAQGMAQKCLLKLLISTSCSQKRTVMPLCESRAAEFLQIRGKTENSASPCSSNSHGSIAANLTRSYC
uniref:Membrane bound O-acyltransferase domain containing 1 n=1 Tax=Anas zonorhyncha TaxID=75864 RepID=A0A8B9TZK1_9AVES